MQSKDPDKRVSQKSDQELEKLRQIRQMVEDKDKTREWEKEKEKDRDASK